jgi:hypothetical protein
MHDELRDALRRVDPPEGFAERVLRNAAAAPVSPGPAPLVETNWRRMLATRLAIAATLVIAIGAGAWYSAEEERRREGEEAKRQVLVSLNIAGSKLREVQMRVNHEQER